jgi:ADP-ribose pyrophosphatase YjhB (NUDIX family)
MLYAFGAAYGSVMPNHILRSFSIARLKARLPFPRLGVRGLVIDAAGKVLLVRHTYIEGWYLPGGGVEKGETAEASLVRELSEEANIEALERPRLHGLFLNAKVSARDHVACYIVRQFRQSAPVTPNLEIAEARFFGIASLPTDTTRATRARIEEVFEGRAAAEIW